MFTTKQNTYEQYNVRSPAGAGQAIPPLKNQF